MAKAEEHKQRRWRATCGRTPSSEGKLTVGQWRWSSSLTRLEASPSALPIPRSRNVIRQTSRQGTARSCRNDGEYLGFGLKPVRRNAGICLPDGDPHRPQLDMIRGRHLQRLFTCSWA